MNSLVMSISRTATNVALTTGICFTDDLDDLGEVSVSLVEIDGALFGLMFRPPDPEGGIHIYSDDRRPFTRDDKGKVLAALGYGSEVVYWELNG
jgi:hypothetical protein